MDGLGRSTVIAWLFFQHYPLETAVPTLWFSGKEECGEQLAFEPGRQLMLLFLLEKSVAKRYFLVSQYILV
jgi:hypothetical protein